MLPDGFTERMQRLLGDEYAAFLSSYALPRNVGLRKNPRKLKGALPFCGDPVPWEPDGFYYDPAQRPALHPYHDAGLYYLQEPSAMAPARLLDVLPGQRVLDLCAAPGGKSTQLAAALRGKGLLVCNELHPKRAGILSSNIERMGVPNALVLNEHPARLAERFPRWFDRILVDAPCSGEGMFRKEDAAAADWSERTVARCAARQSEILASAAKMLKPGGRLVYSTCTFSPEENEGVISRFLRENPAFSCVKPDAPWFSRGMPEWIDAPAAGVENAVRLFPHRLRGEGHFAAVLQRADDCPEGRTPVRRADALPEEARKFLAENAIEADGMPLLFGEVCCLVPEDLPATDGLRILRAGLELGRTRKGRFLPAHALALWLDCFPRRADFPADSREIAAYLHGETLRGSQTGWTLVTVDGYSLGWAYGADGILKNHYPKGLRRLGD